jgi:single-strand DNA-binding protein
MSAVESSFSDTNLVVLAGRVSAEPVITELPSGSVLYSWSVNVGADGGPATSVPVVQIDPPAAARRTRAGAEVVVTGAVRRRFFRAAGATQSRTEVVASRLVSAGRVSSVEAALRAVRESLTRLG